MSERGTPKKMPKRRAHGAHDAILDHYGEVADEVRAQGGSAGELDRVINALNAIGNGNTGTK